MMGGNAQRGTDARSDNVDASVHLIVHQVVAPVNPLCAELEVVKQLSSIGCCALEQDEHRGGSQMLWA